MPRRIITWDEQDAYSRSGRKYLCWLNRAGAVKSVKRRTHRRERREGQAEIREQVQDA